MYLLYPHHLSDDPVVFTGQSVYCLCQSPDFLCGQSESLDCVPLYLMPDSVLSICPCAVCLLCLSALFFFFLLLFLVVDRDCLLMFLTFFYFSDPSGSNLFFCFCCCSIPSICSTDQVYLQWSRVSSSYNICQKISLAVSVTAVFKVVIIESMSESSLFMMVRGANVPPIVAWKVSKTLGSFIFSSSNWFFPDKGCRSSCTTRGHFLCLVLENFVSWQCHSWSEAFPH